MPVGSPVADWRGYLQPVLLKARAVHLEELDVDHDFGPRLVDRADDARGGGDAIGRVLDGDRVGRRDAGDAPRVDDDAEEVDRFLEIRVAQVERPDDLFLVLTSLGGRIGRDGHRARRGDSIEVVCARRHGDERVLERCVVQIDRDRLLAECGIEDHVDAAEPAERSDDASWSWLR